MVTDTRQLTEAAARACGFKLDDWYWVEHAGRELLHVVEDGTYNRIFDPLNDSEMAMEVAARLEIQIDYANSYMVFAHRQKENLLTTPYGSQFIPGDLGSKQAAIRRSITVCAAAYVNTPYVQYDANVINKHERDLQAQGWEFKLDVSGGFWLATDYVTTHIGESKNEVIMLAASDKE